MPSFSIKKTAPFAILFPLLTCVGLLGWIGFENGRRTANKLADTTMNSLSNQIHDKLQSLISQPMFINQTNAEAIRLGHIDLNKPDSLLANFWSQMQVFKNVNGIQFGYSAGQLRGIVRESKEQTLTFDVVENNQNVLKKYNVEGKGNRAKEASRKIDNYFTQKRLWYIEGKKSQEPIWTEIFKKKASENVELRVTAVQSIYQQNKLVGVLAVDFFLSQVSEFLKSIKKFESNEILIFIVDQEGKLVASTTDSDRNPIFTDITESSDKIKRLKASQSNDRLIKVTGIELETHHQNSNNQNKDVSFKLEKDVSEIQRVQVRHVRKENLNWRVVVVVPERIFMQSIHNTRYVAIILAVCTVGVSIVLGLWVTNWLINPILQLSNAAEKIVSEEFDANSLDLMTKRNDEIGELSRVFQQMANIVYTREKSLKQQVQDLISETDKAKKAAFAQQQTGVDVQALLARSQYVREKEKTQKINNFK
jgi:HAMP domain-containing protein